MPTDYYAVFNTEAEAVPPFGCVTPTGEQTDDGALKVGKPKAGRAVLVNGPSPIPAQSAGSASGIGFGSVVGLHPDDIRAKYGGAEPAAPADYDKESLGVADGDWFLRSRQGGYRPLALATAGAVMVRPDPVPVTSTVIGPSLRVSSRRFMPDSQDCIPSQNRSYSPPTGAQPSEVVTLAGQGLRASDFPFPPGAWCVENAANNPWMDWVYPYGYYLLTATYEYAAIVDLPPGGAPDPVLIQCYLNVGIKVAYKDGFSTTTIATGSGSGWQRNRLQDAVCVFNVPKLVPQQPAPFNATTSIYQSGVVTCSAVLLIGDASESGRYPNRVPDKVTGAALMTRSRHRGAGANGAGAYLCFHCQCLSASMQRFEPISPGTTPPDLRNYASRDSAGDTPPPELAPVEGPPS